MNKILTWSFLVKSIGLNLELEAEDILYAGVSIDTRKIEPGQAFFCIQGHKLDGHEFAEIAVQKGAVLIISERKLNLGVPELIVPNTTQAMADLARVYRNQFDIPVLALTGSCGKTGTKEMVSAICRELGETLSTQGNLNNQWGVPLTLFQLKNTHRFAVIEMGTSAPGEIEFLAKIAQPTVSLITNIRHQHVEGMGSLEGISQEKSNIFKYLKKNGTAVLNQAEKFYPDWLAQIQNQIQNKIQKITFGKNSQADCFPSDIQINRQGTCFKLHTPLGKINLSVPLLGEHVVENAVAASAMAASIGASLDDIKNGLAKIKPTPGRLYPHFLDQNILLIDDTYNASPSAVESAINWLSRYSGKKIFVMSNMAALAEKNESYHLAMGEWICQAKIDQCLFYGDENSLLYVLNSLKIKNSESRAKRYGSKQDLLEDLKLFLEPNTVVLIKGSRGNQMETIVHGVLEGVN